MKILAISDTHVSADLALAGCRPQTPQGPAVLVQAAAAFEWAADLAMEHRVGLIVHAGDLYETPRPGPAAETVAVEGLLAFSRVAPTVIIPGNHDTPVGGGVHALAPLRSIAPGRLVVADTPQPIGQVAWANVYPIPYPHRGAYGVPGGTPEEVRAHVSAALDRVLTAHALDAETGGDPAILLYHGTIAGARFRPHQIAPAHDMQIAADGRWDAFDATICGHIHARQDVPGMPGRLAYVGALDRHDFGEEDDTPGAVLYDTEARTATVIPYPGARHFRTLEIVEPPPDTLLERYAEKAGGRPGPGLVFRLAGDLEPSAFAEVGALVRRWRAAGWCVANACTVRETARTRVTLDRVDHDAAIDAAFAARPDLAADRSAIEAGIREVL